MGRAGAAGRAARSGTTQPVTVAGGGVTGRGAAGGTTQPVDCAGACAGGGTGRPDAPRRRRRRRSTVPRAGRPPASRSALRAGRGAARSSVRGRSRPSHRSVPEAALSPRLLDAGPVDLLHHRVRGDREGAEDVGCSRARPPKTSARVSLGRGARPRRPRRRRSARRGRRARRSRVRLRLGQRAEDVQRVGVEGQADVGRRRSGGRPHVGVDDRPERLVGVVGVERQPEQVRRVDLVAVAARRPRSASARSAGRARPQRPAPIPITIPQASFGYSARAWATIAARICRGSSTVPGPGCRIRAPASTGSPHHQLTPPSRSASISSRSRENVPAERYFQPPSGSSATIVPDAIVARHPGRRDEHGPARGPGEDPLAEDEVAQRGHRVAVRDEVLPVEQARVEDLGHEPLVERAQPLDVLAGQRLGGVDPDARLALAGRSARRPSACRRSPARPRRRRPPGSRPGSPGRSSRSGLAGWPGCRTGRASRSAGPRSTRCLARAIAPFEPSAPGESMTSAPKRAAIWRRSWVTLSGMTRATR